MSEVRLVRCPKCDKVLPEPSGFPVYKCGGCGAFLRARKKSSATDGLLDGSVEDKVVNFGGGDLDKEDFVKEGSISMNGETEFHGGLPKSPMRDRFLDDLVKTPVEGSRNVSRSPVRITGRSSGFDDDGFEFGARSSNVSKSPVRGRGMTPVSVRTREVTRSPLREGESVGDVDGRRSTTRSLNVDNPNSLIQGRGYDFEGNTRHERVSEMNAIRDGRSGENYTGGRRSVWRESRDQVGDKHMSSDEHESTMRSMNGDVPNSLVQGCGSDFEGNTRHERVSEMTATRERRSGENYTGGRRSVWRDQAGYKPVSSDEHDSTSERSFDDSIHGGGRNKGGMYQEGRLGGPRSVDGPSNNYSGPSRGYGDARQSSESSRGSADIQDSHFQRAELRRKYNPSGEQQSSLYDAEDSAPRFCREPMKQFQPERNYQAPSHFRRSPGQVDHRENMYNANHPAYEDRFSGQMKRGPRSNEHLLKHEVPEYVSGHSSNYDHDPRDSYVNDRHAHHPACDCSLCCHSNYSQSRDQHNFSDHRRQDHHLAANSTYSDDMGRERYASQACDPRGRPSHAVHQRKRVQAASLNKRLCRPISGGAPFVLCNNCFQLLIVPGNVMAKHKKQQLQCGSCSTLISVDLQNKSSSKSSFVPVLTESKPEYAHESEIPAQVTNESGPTHHPRDSFAASTNVGSYDFDAGGYNLRSLGSEASSVTKGHTHNSSLPENSIQPTSSPSRFSMDESVSDTQSVRSSQLNSRAAEKQVIDEETSREDPLLMTDATETDVHFSELPTTGLSQDSEDISRESSMPGSDKVVQSHMDALLNGFAVLSRQGTPVRAEVYVNGQPIPNRLVKEAEKLAGPIEPGEYWYDPKAGFWGVMGHRCLGIIPPFIEEFRFPMPENCSSGDSNVFVNGRELQERDLNLLARRGFPTTRGMYYVVDISGKVVDEQTGDFVADLGKLAPSVERNKRGFGMQVPEELDD